MSSRSKPSYSHCSQRQNQHNSYHHNNCRAPNMGYNNDRRYENCKNSGSSHHNNYTKASTSDLEEGEEARARRRLLKSRQRLDSDNPELMNAQENKTAMKSDRILDQLIEDVKRRSRTQPVDDFADLILGAQGVDIDEERWDGARYKKSKKHKKEKKKEKKEKRSHSRKAEQQKEERSKDGEKCPRKRKHGEKKEKSGEVKSEPSEEEREHVMGQSEEDDMPVGADFQLFKPTNAHFEPEELSGDEESSEPEEDEGERPSLAAILSAAPPKFPWLFPIASGKKIESKDDKSIAPPIVKFPLAKEVPTPAEKEKRQTTGPASFSWLFPPRNQQIPIKMKGVNYGMNLGGKEKKAEKVTEIGESCTGAQEKVEEEEEVEEGEKEKEVVIAEKEEEIKRDDSSVPVEYKAMSGGTLWQRAATTAASKGQKVASTDSAESPSLLLPAAASISNPLLSAALSDGNTQLGIVTPATRAAATSEWRKKSERELKKQSKTNASLRKIMRSPLRESQPSSGSEEECTEDGVSDDGGKDFDQTECVKTAEDKAKRKREKKAKKEKKRKKEREHDADEDYSIEERKHKRKKSKRTGQRSEASTEEVSGKKRHRFDSRSSSRAHATSRNRSNSRDTRLRAHSRSRSRGTYSSSSISPIRTSRRRSHSPVVLPHFSRRRAFENRRRLIEDSWHRRIEQSVRPCNELGEKTFDEANYTDASGRIDKQKLLEIATRNATKLAMEGKLPKGAELTETIKNKSVDHLVSLCKQLQSEKDLLPKRGRDSSDDEESKYSHRYERWREEKDRHTDREFRNRAVRPADQPARLSQREQRETVRHEENALRLTFPVSSGVTHRTKTNEAPPPEPGTAGPLVRYGDIGPLTSALAKVRTNIPSAYKPLSKPLATAQPTSTLSSSFQCTSAIAIGPQLLEPMPLKPTPSYPEFVSARTPDCVNASAYEIALAATARKQESEQRPAAAEPVTATSANFVGPVQPNPAAEVVLAAATALGGIVPFTQYPVPQTVVEQPPKQQPLAVFSSSWDRPGHIAAREALIQKIAEQKRLAEEAERNRQQPEKVQAEERTKTTSQREEASGGQGTLPKSQGNLQPDSTTAVVPVPNQLPTRDGSEAAKETSTAKGTTESDCLFKKPLQSVSTKVSEPVPPISAAPTVKGMGKEDGKERTPTAVATDESAVNGLEGENKGKGQDFLDRFHSFAEAQIARQKAESVLHATILSTQLQQRAQSTTALSKGDLSTFASSSAPVVFRPDPIGLTRVPKSIQDLVTERLRYTQRLQYDPNDYEARKGLARLDEEMADWAQSSSLPGEFTGHTGARVLSEKELGPNDPRFHAWAKKDQFRNAPEVNSGIGLRLMQRMGWQPGQGLGKDKAGSVAPLDLDVKSDRKGLFSSDERAPTRESCLDPTGKNPVSVLMEQCSRLGWQHPEFYCVESGPQNNKRYLWKAVLNGVEYAPSLPSSNKRAGKAQVCMVVLEALGWTQQN